jgi:hypothetical protein
MDEIGAVFLAACVGLVIGLFVADDSGRIKRDCELLGKTRVGSTTLICEKK